MRPSAERRRAWRLGRRSEWLCAWYLRLKGYRILARNLRLPAGELDLVARRGRLLVFVEVKARAGPADPEAITPRQRRRIERAAGAFLGRNPALAGLDCRFDALLLARGRLPVHIADAWRPGMP
jgi:putative endonuclease